VLKVQFTNKFLYWKCEFWFCDVSPPNILINIEEYYNSLMQCTLFLKIIPTSIF